MTIYTIPIATLQDGTQYTTTIDTAPLIRELARREQWRRRAEAQAGLVKPCGYEQAVRQ